MHLLELLPAHNWTFDDNKAFELALAQHFHDNDRWSKIATKLPGKTLPEIQRHYELLEEDVNRIHESSPSPRHDGPVLDSCFAALKKVKTEPEVHVKAEHGHPPAGLPAASSLDRRKGVPWTQDEHRLFLLGLAKFGKGSWRSIARQFVVTRTPTQVASHAQKYFLRLNSFKDKKDKRRASIHDITTDHVVQTDLYGVHRLLPGMQNVSSMAIPMQR